MLTLFFTQHFPTGNLVCWTAGIVVNPFKNPPDLTPNKAEMINRKFNHRLKGKIKQKLSMNCQFYLFPGQTVNTIAEKPLIYTHLFNPFSFSDFKFSLTCKLYCFWDLRVFKLWPHPAQTFLSLRLWAQGSYLVFLWELRTEIQVNLSVKNMQCVLVYSSTFVYELWVFVILVV